MIGGGSKLYALLKGNYSSLQPLINHPLSVRIGNSIQHSLTPAARRSAPERERTKRECASTWCVRNVRECASEYSVDQFVRCYDSE